MQMPEKLFREEEEIRKARSLPAESGKIDGWHQSL
jgi:hypothetical protein